jgi:hypothetical protein
MLNAKSILEYAFNEMLLLIIKTGCRPMCRYNLKTAQPKHQLL